MKTTLLLAFTIISVAAAEVAPPLHQAHAHNDYEHKRPLLDALELGFSSIEADVHLKNGRLLVGHDPEDLSDERTIESLYLDPLKRAIQENGRLFSNPASLLLLVDIKTGAEETYTALKPLLEKYSPILTLFDGDTIRTNAVTVVLSGNRPRETLLQERRRYAAFDGRLADLGKDLPVSFMPLVSDNWTQHFTWRGTGSLGETERLKLTEIVRRAHAENRKLRFWATPDNESCWTVLRAAGVDLINTDKLKELADFLRK